MSEIEILKSHILVTREEYGEYVILKHAAILEAAERNIKEAKLERMRELSHEKVLDTYFRFERMGSDTRREQTDLRANNNYAGFTQKVLVFLRTQLGYTDVELINYINAQWDVREAREAAEREAEMEAAAARAASSNEDEED